MADAPAPVYVVQAPDPVILADAVGDLVDRLVGDDDRSLVVAELDADDYETDGGEPSVDPVVGALETAPFLTDQRVIVARHAGLFSKAAIVAPLVDYLADPLETSRLVLVWEKGPKQQRLGALPKKLAEAVDKAGGETIGTKSLKGKGAREWINGELADHEVSLDAAARDLVVDNLGEDVARLRSILDTLASTHGTGRKLGVDDVAPYLTEEGGLAPWDLTDAIDAGDIADALHKLHRMLAADRHPLQLMATLQRHYSQLLALDGADVVDENTAAELLGINKGFPAKKIWNLSRQLDTAQVKEAVDLLAQADIDLRGATAWPPELVMEVLVARLAHRCSGRRR